MINLGNLGGTLMLDDLPLCDFKFVGGYFDTKRLNILCGDMRRKPALILDYHHSYGWELFFREQIIPETRQGLLKSLAVETPIRSYNPEQILRYCECRNTANDYWVKCDDDLSCWEPWQIEELRKLEKIS